MINSRASRAKLNILVSLGTQIITLICGFIVPRLMIGTFGSEAYGATASINQFLAYIALLEGGIGGVARAVLYEPLSQKDNQKISDILFELKQFFRIVAFIFAVYSLIIACFFKQIANIVIFEWSYTFVLVLVISISTFMQYYIGIAYAVLIQAAQKSYISNAISIMTSIVNTIIIIVMVNLECDLIVVKLMSSCIFVCKPVLMYLYVEWNYKLTQYQGTNKKLLKQKWDGLGQHLAFFLHSNTDIVVLTFFTNLSVVAVYSVYNMIMSHMQSLVVSFLSGMEALFGDMIAKKEHEKLQKTFSYYETLISIIGIVFFATTAILIVPFVEIYTMGIVDTNYKAPVFAVLLTLSALIYCLRMPYHCVVIAAGHFKQTRNAAYGEVIINLVLSVGLVSRFGMTGVMCGTVISMLFRFLYYVYYLSHNILFRNIQLFVKRQMINIISFILIFIIGMVFTNRFDISSYYKWFGVAIIVFLFAILITISLNCMFYKNETKDLVIKVKNK